MNLEKKYRKLLISLTKGKMKKARRLRAKIIRAMAQKG
jgi:hypothetical protein